MNDARIRMQIKTRIWIFVVGVLICGWFGRLVNAVLPEQQGEKSCGSLIWLVTPFILSVILALANKSSYKRLAWDVNFKGNGAWYLVSIFFFPVCTLIPLAIGISAGVIDTTNFEMKDVAVTFGIWFLYNFFRNILEETAWRGFLTERLLALGLSDLKIYVITALVWSTWHIPYYLYFYGEGDAITLILSNYIVLLCWTPLFTEIYRITKSIWPCIILHAMANAVQYTMLEDHFMINSMDEFIFSPANGCIACVLAILGGVIIKRIRENVLES